MATISEDRKYMFQSRDEEEIHKPARQKASEQQERDFIEIKDAEAAAAAEAAGAKCVQVSENIFLGNAAASNESVLKDFSITHVFAVGKDLPPCLDPNKRLQDAEVMRNTTPNAAAEADLQYTYERNRVHYMCLEIPDTPDAPLLNYAHGANEFIHGALEAGGRVLVLDAQGASLAPTMIAFYLISSISKNAEQSLELLSASNPAINFGKERLKNFKFLERSEGQLPDWAMPA
mmetsp:Transcript_6948/g.7941  ORF Transcript_6948/g.7941 Transcript_6948/m.7941 type:complete len:233 (+) Transcript_6948:115-813(+)|eukprot:CAMPEP_0197854240 /NCGR_PEP_ID=MMETSP1438-20131217/24303_1 /TAXON_ID=1461541 /ORGANISM="Pterosperma sp., Strain CCMP1384" /LENGTH=232 /DNA_ID=CAMNT_0043468909 /DNA_START=94 /DNA_END=792 /DNA_ORIENTATION=+